MKKIWDEVCWEDYLYWQRNDRNVLKRINELLRDIERDPFGGKGKPEPLKHDRQGYWSRRINEVDRLVYRVHNGQLELVSCRSHYDD
jgi:toxin YoeB